jgi:tRNA dimethylallyltransferase
MEEAVAAAQQGHRNYAKRQLTWFRREPEVHWIESFGDAAEAKAYAIKLVRNAMDQSARPASWSTPEHPLD